jgi:Ser/Thr protein kinase RdoA (MazF antagonist)
VNSRTPFAGLTPETVLDATEAVGFTSDGHLFALNSYENRVYQLGAPGHAVVVKFYRPGRWSDEQIREEHEFTAELAAGDLNVAAPLAVEGETLLRFREFRFTLFPHRRGRAPDLDAPDARVVLGRSLARLHRIGALRPFRSRPALTTRRLGHEARAVVLRTPLLPAHMLARYEQVSTELLGRVEDAFAASGPLRSLRLHGDCHLGNVLWGEQGPVFVDLDDCCSGPAIQDLWMLLSGSPDEQRHQWEQIMEGYEQFAELDLVQLRLVEPLRALRMVHHAAWVAQRWEDPAFPRAFPWFGEPRFWEGHVNDLAEQLAAVEDPPLLRG